MSNLHKGHRFRVKQEYRENGLDHFPEHKILEILLFYSIPRADTNKMGHMLLERFGTISGVMDAPLDLLLETEGLGLESATLLKLVSDIIRVYKKDDFRASNIIRTSEDAREYMRNKFLCKPIEVIYIACIGANGKVVYCNQISEGSPETVSIRLVDVARMAVRSNAERVVLAHNHPYGICNPSLEDRHATEMVQKKLYEVDVELFDHIIVAPDGVFSMREANMIPSIFNII